MNILYNFIKIFFHLINIVVIIFYLYPGSILGWLLYGDLAIQPNLTADFLKISSNHFYVFSLLTFSGIIAYYQSKKINFILKYLLSISILLEFFHFIIPKRSFQLEDLVGNFFGFILVYLLYKVWKIIIKKKENNL
tara:strand:+ start:1974 stop:2381 length:408 start_codon:yes stop_codon:yes gene_type:complete